MNLQHIVFTIGHSTHSQERFIDLLSQHAITAVCDVRSKPYSRRYEQFNREQLKSALKANGIAYVFLGKELGARREDPSCYENGKVGIQRVQDGMKNYRVALMCAEKEPLECHRTILVARRLAAIGLDVQHIYANGATESHADALKRLTRMLNLPQADMFNTTKEAFSDVYRRQEERIAYEGKAVAETESPAIGSVAG